jgi:predicted NBD/HSP70 family sugar kinase
MLEKSDDRRSLVEHGGKLLPQVCVDDYSAEIRDGNGFVGDRASKKAFREILGDWRARLARIHGDDPLGDGSNEKRSKKKLDKLLKSGDPAAAAVLHSAIEEFAQQLTLVIRRFLRLKSWAGTERIVVGGGFRESRVGEVVIARTAALLQAEKIAIELKPIGHHPDNAGLLGAAQLAPSWIFAGHDGILAVDIGGTNIRVGLVDLNFKSAKDLTKAKVADSEIWRHADDHPKRDEAIERMVEMLRTVIKQAEKGHFRLAPFIGVACPGTIEADGSIKRGTQNLPGNWEGNGFNLPRRLREALPTIGGHQTAVVMHNDAVVQGLSEAPQMSDVKHWGVLTIGTGLGNARFSKRQ